MVSTIRKVVITLFALIIVAFAYVMAPIAFGSVPSVSAASLDQAAAKNLEIVDRRGGQTTDVVVEGNYAYTMVGTRLLALDLSNPATPTKVGALVLSYPVLDMVINNGLIYVSAGASGLHIISVTDPAYPVEIGTYPGSYGDGIAFQGSYVYIFDVTHFYVIDVTQPASPVQTGVYAAPEGVNFGKQGPFLELLNTGKPMAVHNNYAYLLSSQGLTIFDVANPTTPQMISAIATSWWSTGLTVVENDVYLSWWGMVHPPPPMSGTSFGGFEVVDVSSPNNPLIKSTFQPQDPLPAFQIALLGTHVYLISEDALRILDASDLQHPKLENTTNIPAQAIVIEKDRLYVFTGEKGLRIFGLSDPTEPQMMGSFNDWLAFASFNVLGLQGSLLYASGNGGLQILDASKATLPVLGSLAVGGNLFAIDANRAYLYWIRYGSIYGNTYGITIVDVSDPFLPAPLTERELGGTWMGSANGPIYVKTVAKQRLYSYSQRNPGEDATLHILDLNDPLSPTLGTFGPVGGTMLVKGNYAYVAGKSSGIMILDVTAFSTPTLVNTYSAIGNLSALAATDSHLFAASDDGLHILDISVPTSPVEVGRSATVTQVQQLAAKGDYLYIAQANDGLHGFDIADPTRPTEVAFYPGVGSLQVVPGMDNKLYVAAGANGLLTLQLSGTITGKVVDSFGKPHAGVKVTLNTGQTTETNAQGGYSFASLPPGSYTVKVESSTYDFQPAEQTLRVPSYLSNSFNFILLPKPLSINVTPSALAHLSYIDLQGNSIDFDVPAGAVTQPTTFNVLPQASAAAPGQFFTGVRFDLQTGEVSNAVSNFTFTAPLTITLHYTDSAVAPVTDRNQLLLRWWDGSQWVDATTTCPSAAPALHDLESQVLTTTVCQSGQFALFGPTVQQFLPLVSRSQVATSEMRGHFVVQHSGQCLNVWRASQENWAAIAQYPCEGHDNETWTIRPQGEYLQIVAKHSQKCLNVSNVSQDEGAQVIQYSCSGGDNELWRMVSVGDNLYQIIVKHSGQCLTVQDAAQWPSTPLIQQNCTESLNQIWRFQAAN